MVRGIHEQDSRCDTFKGWGGSFEAGRVVTASLGNILLHRCMIMVTCIDYGDMHLPPFLCATGIDFPEDIHLWYACCHQLCIFYVTH